MRNAEPSLRESRMRARMAKAVFGLALLLAAVLVADEISERMGAGFLAGGGRNESVVATNVAQLDQANELLKGMGQRGVLLQGAVFAESVYQAVPASFVREGFGLKPFNQAMVAEGGMLLGLQSEEPPSRVFGQCAGQLQEKGWAQVATGQAYQASFVKESGTYRWMLLSCTGVQGGCSCVVVLNGEEGVTDD